MNGSRITEKLVSPGDILRVAKHKYRVEYSPIDLGAVGPPPSDQPDVLRKSLLERAGLAKSGSDQGRYDVNRSDAKREPGRRVDLLDDSGFGR